MAEIKACIHSLPDKPSDLIEVALDDLEKVEKDSRYVVNMGAWHSHFSDDPELHPKAGCHVCLAGAVMAMRVSLEEDDAILSYSPCNIPELRDKLIALDNFRIGMILDGVVNTTGKFPSFETKGELLRLQNQYGMMEVEGYEDDPDLFKQRMFDMADSLRKLGL